MNSIVGKSLCYNSEKNTRKMGGQFYHIHTTCWEFVLYIGIRHVQYLFWFSMHFLLYLTRQSLNRELSNNAVFTVHLQIAAYIQWIFILQIENWASTSENTDHCIDAFFPEDGISYGEQSLLLGINPKLWNTKKSMQSIRMTGMRKFWRLVSVSHLWYWKFFFYGKILQHIRPYHLINCLDPFHREWGINIAEESKRKLRTV